MTIVRRCCLCEREFGIKQDKRDRISHGYCYRHALAQLAVLYDTCDVAVEHILNKRNESEFCADMSQIFDG